jgi:DNA-binding transcriptional ArsR family regulator
MKAMQVIRDPEAYQLLADETRRKIIYLLRVKEMTVGQLAADLNLTPQAVYHHVKKLLKGEMVEVTREERSGHLIESYYRATAETFSLSYGKMKTQSLRDKKMAKERIVASLNVLKTLGFKLEYDENKISQLVDTLAGLEECCSDEKLEDSIYEREDLDYLVKATAKDLASTLSMSDEEAARQEKIRKKLRTLLLSMVKK